jgi:hypothetical protein
MGTRSLVACLALALALGACSEQQDPESVAGPTLAGRPTDPAACDPNSLNSLISGYFPGSSGNADKTLKDQLIAAGANSPDGLAAGYTILQDIGNLSRNQTVNGAAGSLLAQGIIKCMFTAKNFPGFPDSSIYNFAPALNADSGGAFYVRGGSGAETPVHGAVGIHTDTPNILSGVNPLTGTWASALSASPGGQALIYGYRISGYPFNNDPFVYEWATIPPGTTFADGALVALCDEVNPSTAMLNESNIGVLAYQGAGPICDPLTGYSVTLKDTGWGPRALAARLAHVVVDALQPQPLQATTLGKSGTGGTATTFKSKFQKKTVTTVALNFQNTLKSTIHLDESPTLEVRATVDNGTTGVNGVCIYLVGSNNNGLNTALSGSEDPRCQHVDKTVNDYTESKLVGTKLQAGYASFTFSVNKTGGLTITATASDDQNSNIGAVGRDGQTFGTDQLRTNVKP